MPPASVRGVPGSGWRGRSAGSRRLGPGTPTIHSREVDDDRSAARASRPAIPRGASQGDPRAAGDRASARAPGPARPGRIDRRRADRPRLGLGRARCQRGRPGRGGARPPRRADRPRPGERPRARGDPRRRIREGGPAGGRVRARPAPPGRLAGRSLDDPLSGRRRRSAHPPDGPPRAGGAPDRPAQHQERRAQGGDRLPGQRLVEPGPGRRAVPGRGPAQRERAHPRPQPPEWRPDPEPGRSPPDRRGAGRRPAARHRPARPPRHRTRRLRLAARSRRAVRSTRRRPAG